MGEEFIVEVADFQSKKPETMNVIVTRLKLRCFSVGKGVSIYREKTKQNKTRVFPPLFYEVGNHTRTLPERDCFLE